MKIPSKSRYAVSAMMDLALHQFIRPLTIAEIAEKQKISLSYLEQLFAVLRRAKLVRGTRGPGGGYRLAQEADRITVAQIIRVVDSSKLSTEEEAYLPFLLWEDLSDKIYAYLETITIADCVRLADENGAEASVAKDGKQKKDSENLYAA